MNAPQLLAVLPLDPHFSADVPFGGSLQKGVCMF